jgi:probable F420-dependent oxidoreductase
MQGDKRMELGLNLPVAHPVVTPGMLRDMARLAEDLGFAEVYLGEHVVLFDEPVDPYPGSESGKAFFPATLPIPDPLIGLSFVAACTERIRLATGVMLLPQRNPVYTAKHIASVDWLSQGRLDVAIGVGWSSEEFAACAVPWDRRNARCDEYVEVMRALWREGVSEHHGELYSLEPCRQYPKPVQLPHPPLWFGGYTDRALDRVARLGDGWYGFDLSPELLIDRLEVLRARLEASARTFGEIKIAVGAYNLMPELRSNLAAYRSAGVAQVVISLRSPDPADMAEEIRWAAREYSN